MCHFVGVDCSLYAVVKACVLIKLFERNAAIDNITQIWFSSMWNSDTLDAFRAAVQSCLLDEKYDSLIKEVLCFWCSTCPLARLEARAKWFALHSMESSLFATVPNLSKAEDRSRVTHYLMTGELFLRPGTAVGNVMLFTDYPRFTARMSNESILNRIPLAELIRKALNGMSFWSIIESYLLDRIDRLKHLIHDEHRLQIQVIHGRISPTNTALIGRLRSLDPMSISWSNIIDYHQPNIFHELARRLSTPNTCHYGYSLNYSGRVFGTYLADFKDKSERLRVLAECMQECRRLVHEYNWTGGRCLTSDQEPISFYDNIARYPLARKYGVNQWLENYFRCEGVFIETHELEPYTTFIETAPNYHLVWKYTTESILRSLWLSFATMFINGKMPICVPSD